MFCVFKNIDTKIILVYVKVFVSLFLKSCYKKSFKLEKKLYVKGVPNVMSKFFILLIMLEYSSDLM